ncbi:MAG TPA: HAMP domain-containing protein [Chloroflexi bacterium]|jgi:two-component system sensor histidine kinase UhpB|nr:HAMP domain-containing protein [Chloroflexota bacterium]
MLITVVPVAALLIALAAVGFFSFTQLTRTLVEQRDSELVQLAAQQVAGYWADSVYFLSSTASSEPVRTGDLERSQLLLWGSTPLAERFDRVSITDALGTITVTRGGELGENLGDQPYFERARRLRTVVRSDVHNDSSGRSVIVVAVPIFDARRGGFAGCVLGTWDLEQGSLGQALAQIRVGEHGFAYLVDSTGTILYHPSRDLIRADARQHPAVAALLNGETGAQTITFRDRTTVVGYAPIPLRERASSLVSDETWGGWGLLTSELWDDIIAPVRPKLIVMGLLLILVVALPLTIVAYNSRRIVAPLQSLVTQAERVASGEFDSQVSVNQGPQEVRELELAFNVMVDQLRKYRNDIQNYVVSILTSQEEERKRIARELHDETAQALVVLGRRIEMAEEIAHEPELAAELDSLRDMVDDTLHGVRRFTRDLRPPLLEELGLPRTLELLGYRTEREEAFRVNLSIVGQPQQLLPELELGLYRLAQEGLSNVRRHAQAEQVDVRLIYNRDAVILEIDDDGVGFDASASTSDLVRSGRLGLMGIHERARLFGGRATITSEPGKGTHIRVDIPITAIVLPPEDHEVGADDPAAIAAEGYHGEG